MVERTLADYRAKHDFSKTTEPSGAAVKETKVCIKACGTASPLRPAA